MADNENTTEQKPKLSRAEQGRINLGAGHQLTHEERVKGGQNSARLRKEKKQLRELVGILASSSVSGKKKKEVQEQFGEDLDLEEITKQTVFISKVYNEAVKGNVKAMKLWVELSDEMLNRRKELEIQRLQAEIDALRGNTQQREVPKFTYQFSDFSRNDADTDDES